MLISNVFINCKVKGKNFFTRKQLKVSSNSEQRTGVLCNDLTLIFTSIALKCEYIKAGLGIKV